MARGSTSRKPAAPRAPSAGATERLLTLIATLLDARRPLALTDLRERLPPGTYGGSDEAAERKFERDKELLLELGIPIRYVTDPEEAEQTGYVVDRDKLYLPNLELTPDESAALFLAGSALLEQGEFPYRDDLERALEKVRLRGDVPPPRGAADRVLFHYPSFDGGPAIAETLRVIEQALARHKTLTLVYRSGGDLDGKPRKVDPYGLFCRRGRWLLVGHSHERKSIRVFAVQRIESVQANAAKPRSPDFEIPSGFELGKWVEIAPWMYPRHGPVEVVIDVDPAFVFLAENELGDARGAGAGERGPDGWTRFRVRSTNQDALVEWLLGMGSKARVAAPEPVRARVRERLDAVLGVYGK